MIRRILLLLVLAALALGALPAAAEPPAVATTIDLRGVVTYKQGEGPWYAAFQDQRNRLQEHVRTGSDAAATLEFDVGGRVGINTNTEVILVGSRDVEVVEQGALRTLMLKTGSLWARFSGQEKEIQVQTSGGVMGIKGTEFVVEADEAGATTLSVLEGSVELRPTEGETIMATPGVRVRFLQGQIPELERVEDLLKLRKELEGRFRFFEETLAPLLADIRTNYVPLAGRSREVVLDAVAEAEAAGAQGAAAAREGADAAREGAREAREGAREAREALESLRRAGLLGGDPDGAASGEPPRRPVRLDFPADLAPDGVDLGSQPPEFRWAPVDGAVQYAVVVARTEAMRAPVWTAKVAAPGVGYPAKARPLEPGRYVWRVIPLDAKGRPVGRASQGSFESQGWGTAGPGTTP